MTRTRLVTSLGLALCALTFGCSESRAPGSDGGVDVPDATPVDLPTDATWLDEPAVDGGSETDANVLSDFGVVETCTTPGAFETVGCATCGTTDRFCTSARIWEYSACTVPADAVCTPGDTGTTACGTMCGTQAARCDVSCHWVASGGCAGEGPCVPGTPARTTDGCTGGNTRDRVCEATCTWGAYTACTTMPTDFDGDGATYDVDCDDTSASIFPGSTRPCGTFFCAGSARASTGTQTCNGPGWSVCASPCVEPTPVPCPSGYGEVRACATGGCDSSATETRVCAAGTWGAWSGCPAPGTRPAACDPTLGAACGTCGEGTTYAICDGACVPTVSACFGRGCEPGTATRDLTGCGAGMYRDTVCAATCLPTGTGVCTAFPPEVDILLVIDVTGSHTAVVTRNASVLATELAGAVLADADVRVGVTTFADFPTNPYGSPGDVPFTGVLAPTADSALVTSTLAALPGMNGNDLPESGMEALWDLAGGTPSSESRPFVCATGLVGGGCWRPAAQRAVIVITDVSQHNAPHPALAAGALVEPYAGIAPAPPVWSAVRDRLLSEHIALFAIVPASSTPGAYSDAFPQLQLLVSEVGQDPSQSIAAYPAGTLDWTTVSRDMAAMLARYLGLTP
jgi:hypothetical protein